MGDDELTVSSADLHHAAHQVDSARSAVRDAASGGYAAVQSDSAGWVGDSKKALEQAITELRRHSDALADRLETQSKRITTAAQRYAETERRNAERQKRLHPAGHNGLNMDH